jgi:EAL domain-containing protein (putative c-di-GMP-specific phosphodiesterase class I)
VLHYQPEVRLSDGSIVGMEALARWQHPDQGLIGPDQFISLAEETGLIVPMGTWVMHEACEQAARWRREGHFADGMFVSVNLSSRQLIDQDLLQTVREVLSDTGLPPSALELEMTESGLMEDADQSAEVLRAIRALGVGFAVDDFGTGYSSLSYLKRLPVDTVKIDRTFIDGLGHDSEDEAIVRAIVAMTRALGQRPIAEGVSSNEQSRVLQALGCGLGQGWLFGHPQAPERLTWPATTPVVADVTDAPVIRLIDRTGGRDRDEGDVARAPFQS